MWISEEDRLGLLFLFRWEVKTVDNVLKEAILNGLYDKNENKGNEFIGPQLVNNDDQDKIWFTLRQELMLSLIHISEPTRQYS